MSSPAATRQAAASVAKRRPKKKRKPKLGDPYDRMYDLWQAGWRAYDSKTT